MFSVRIYRCYVSVNFISVMLGFFYFYSYTSAAQPQRYYTYQIEMLVKSTLVNGNVQASRHTLKERHTHLSLSNVSVNNIAVILSCYYLLILEIYDTSVAQPQRHYTC